MPLYEYQCRSCGLRFERWQHMNDAPVKTCPECDGDVYRLIQPVGVVFKGKGFYVTDNRAKSSTAGPSSAKKSPEPAGEEKSPSAGESHSSSE